MNDQQENKLIIDDQMPPLERVDTPGTFGHIHLEKTSVADTECDNLIKAIEAKTANTQEARHERVRQKYILEILQLAEDCDFEISEDLNSFNSRQLVRVRDALRDLLIEQKKP